MSAVDLYKTDYKAASEETDETAGARTRLVYPDQCAKCGRQWGDHTTDRELISRGACPFVAKLGEIQSPTLVQKGGKYVL